MSDEALAGIVVAGLPIVVILLKRWLNSTKDRRVLVNGRLELLYQVEAQMKDSRRRIAELELKSEEGDRAHNALGDRLAALEKRFQNHLRDA